MSIKNRRVWTGSRFVKNSEAVGYMEQAIRTVRSAMPDDDWGLEGTVGAALVYVHKDWRAPDIDVAMTTLLDALSRNPREPEAWHCLPDDRYAIATFSCKMLGDDITEVEDEFCVLYLAELDLANVRRFATESTLLAIEAAERILAGELEVTYKQIWA